MENFFYDSTNFTLWVSGHNEKVRFDILKKLIAVADSEIDLEAIFTEEFIKKYLGENSPEMEEKFLENSLSRIPAYYSTGDTSLPRGHGRFPRSDNNNRWNQRPRILPDDMNPFPNNLLLMNETER
jgi:hypothetical protein